MAGVPYDIVENGTLRLTLGGYLDYAGILRDGGGIFSLTKLGAGDLVLSGTSNNYTGETYIVGGALVGGADNSFSALSRVKIGSVLELAGYDQTVHGFYNSGTILNSSGGSATLTTNSASLNTFSGNIIEVAGNVLTLVKQGSGEQRLIGSSNHSGGTRIEGGTLGFGLDSSFGTGAVEITGAGATIKSLGIDLTLGNDIVLTANGVIDGAGTAPTLSGIISGSGSLTKISSGSLSILNSGNLYSGGTILKGGSLLLGADNVFGDVTKALTVELASGLGTTGVAALLTNDIVADAQLTLLAPDTEVLDIAGVISGAGNIVVSGTTGTVILRQANTYTGLTNSAGGTLGVADNLSLGGSDRSLPPRSSRCRAPAVRRIPRRSPGLSTPPLWEVSTRKASSTSTC